MKTEPIDVIFGAGAVKIEAFDDPADGSFGLVLSNADGQHEPGDTFDSPPEKNHMPQPGEVYLRFKNRKGLRALMLSLVELIDRDQTAGKEG